MSRADYEGLPDAELARRIRTAMGEGCIRPVHVYDMVDVLLSRLEKPRRNCDVGTAEEQVERFMRYCNSRVCKRRVCASCGYEELFRHKCFAIWAQMPYTGGGVR